MLSNLNKAPEVEEINKFSAHVWAASVGAQADGLPFVLALIEEYLTRSSRHKNRLIEYMVKVAPSLGRDFITTLVEMLEGDDPARHMFFQAGGGMLQLHSRTAKM